MRHLPATEADADLHPVAVLQKFLGALHLGVEVVGINTGAHTDLFDLHDPLILPGFLLPLLLIEAELGIVHDLADGGDRIGGDLYKIQFLLLGQSVRLSGGHDAQLGTVRTDHTELLVPDLVVELMF